MPGLQGLDFQTGLRCRHPEIRTVLISATAESRAARAALADGHADRLVAKPWEEAERIAAVWELLG